MGTDSAGRRQYLYHELWRARRDAGKHDLILGFAAALPEIRLTIADHLGGRGLSRQRVLAAAVHLIDDRLFAYWNGRRWHQVTAADINEYLRQIAGQDCTAKDFRTWHATVLAAVGLAVSEQAESAAARKRDQQGDPGGCRVSRQYAGGGTGRVALPGNALADVSALATGPNAAPEFLAIGCGDQAGDTGCDRRKVAGRKRVAP
jgi:hypothetical protein